MTDTSRAQTGTGRRSLAGTALLVFLLALSVFLLFRVMEFRGTLNEYKSDLDSLRVRVDSLRQATLDRSLANPNMPSLLTLYDQRNLKKKGLEEPVENIKADLMGSHSLIPLEGVLGGTMQFYPEQIYVLTDRWVLAYVDDGHIAGYLWLEYRVQNGGRIEWEVLDAYEM